MLISCTAAQVEEASRSRHWTFAICRHSFAEGILRSWRSLGPISRYFHGKQEIILYPQPLILVAVADITIMDDLIDDVCKMYDMTTLSVFLLFHPHHAFVCLSSALHFFFITWIIFRAGTTGILHDVIDSKRDVLLSENVEPTDQDGRSSRLFHRCLSG